MNSCIEIHSGIIASVLGGHITSDHSIVKVCVTRNSAMISFHNASVMLEGMNFREVETLNLPNRNLVRVYEKNHFPYLICLSIETEFLVVTLSSKEEVIAELQDKE